jgi:Cdc6-like AAA superfamily ATPase
VRLTDEFRDASSSVIILYGPVGSGRTSAISKSIAYMSERGLLQSEILYLNLSNCTKRVDFEFKFCQKAKLDRSCDEPSISTIYSDKRLVLVLDNCDGFIENSYDEFLEQMKELLARLNKPKIVLVVTDRTEKNFSNFLLGEKRLSFPPLEVLPAIDMLLSQCKWWIPLK